MVREYIAEKLRAVPLTALVQDQKCSASGGLLTHEEMLYPALDNAVYAPVNQAAKHLGLNLKYGQSHGMQHYVTCHLCSRMLGEVKCDG